MQGVPELSPICFSSLDFLPISEFIFLTYISVYLELRVEENNILFFYVISFE